MIYSLLREIVGLSFLYSFTFLWGCSFYIPNEMKDVLVSVTHFSHRAMELTKELIFNIWPFNDFAMRPTIMLAASNTDDALRLIDRGIKADNSLPLGHAFLLKTSDKRRSVRHVFLTKSTRPLAIGWIFIFLTAMRLNTAVIFYFTLPARSGCSTSIHCRFCPAQWPIT